MKLSLEILYTSIKDDGLSYGENRTCLATLVFEIYRKQKIVGMWLINFVTHCIITFFITLKSKNIHDTIADQLVNMMSIIVSYYGIKTRDNFGLKPTLNVENMIYLQDQNKV